MLREADVDRNPYIGIFCRANDDVAFAYTSAPEQFIGNVEKTLGVAITTVGVGGSNVIGSLMVMNARGAIVSGLATEGECETMRKAGVTVATIPDILNAAGNNILANSHGALVHPRMSQKSIDIIAKTLDVPVKKGLIANVPTVGSVAVVTDKGALAHPHASEDDLALLEELFNVPASIGTANHGSPMVGACMAANTRGVVVGDTTTGPEMGRIEEALGFLE